MDIIQIAKFPDGIENYHESVLRSFQILNKVCQMLKRGDSNETVLEFVDSCNELSMTFDTPNIKLTPTKP